MTRRTTCHCGHAYETHYHGPPTPSDRGVTLANNPCLGLACECKHYRHPDEKEAKAMTRERRALATSIIAGMQTRIREIEALLGHIEALEAHETKIRKWGEDAYDEGYEDARRVFGGSDD